MRILAFVTALGVASVSQALAESRIDILCGPNHVNEAVSDRDVVANPDGFYIRSLKTQISHGDPRIIRATGNVFNFCTRSAATPDMDSTRAVLLMNERRVRYLFVPKPCPTQKVGF